MVFSSGSETSVIGRVGREYSSNCRCYCSVLESLVTSYLMHFWTKIAGGKNDGDYEHIGGSKLSCDRTFKLTHFRNYDHIDAKYLRACFICEIIRFCLCLGLFHCQYSRER